ncbi:MAG: hypothetical protein ACOCQG_04390 [Candidatus Nanoarchaeia archaeon]
MINPSFCVCKKCNHYMPCMEGLDCSAMKCPLCGSKMENTRYRQLE